MQLFFKRIFAKIFLIIIIIKRLISKPSEEIKNKNIFNLFEKYSSKKKIVVLCNGPSANKVPHSKDNLYLVTNSGNTMVKKHDFLYYINDGYYVKKALALGKYFFNKNQDIIFYFENSKGHKAGLNYLKKNLKGIRTNNYYLISNISNFKHSFSNYTFFHEFYSDRAVQVKIQNSDVFLLLMGYLLSVKMKLPLEIYGLDLGEGGALHFDKKGVVGKSVTSKRVRKNVEVYLNMMYEEHSNISNFSNFCSNMY